MFLTYAQVAEKMQVDESFVRKLVKDGDLTPVYIGKEPRIKQADLENFKGSAAPKRKKRKLGPPTEAQLAARERFAAAARARSAAKQAKEAPAAKKVVHLKTPAATGAVAKN